MAWRRRKLITFFFGILLLVVIIIIYEGVTNSLTQLQMGRTQLKGKDGEIKVKISSKQALELLSGIRRALTSRDTDFIRNQIEGFMKYACGDLDEENEEETGEPGWLERECLKMRQLTTTELYNNTTLKSFQGEKLVHIDLKGAPPLVSYFRQFFPYIRKLGATGVLIEYEDMFFYSNELQNIRAKNAYTPKDIRTILRLSEENNLMVIPMIQVLGHLEFILKLNEYKELREVKDSPETLCPTNEKTFRLLKKMIDQIVEAHPNSNYIHLGCNEMEHLATCGRCRDLMAQNKWSVSEFYLKHLKKISVYINITYPGVRPIVWGDMFNEFEKPIIVKSEINDLVDVMVLVEKPTVTDYLTDRLIYLYASVFRRIWVASTFNDYKRPNQRVNEINFPLENQISWMDVMNKWKRLIKFKGIALIGRQRRNHFSELCELLPVSTPSLTASLAYLNNTDLILSDSRKIVPCAYPLAFQFSSYESSKCTFPGSRIYRLVNEFYILYEKIRTALNINSQFSVYNMLEKYVNPVKFTSELQSVEKNLRELTRLENKLKTGLLEMYDIYTAEEWIGTYVTPARVKLEALIWLKEVLQKQDTWPRRPFALKNSAIKQIANKICASDSKLPCSLLFM